MPGRLQGSGARSPGTPVLAVNEAPHVLVTREIVPRRCPPVCVALAGAHLSRFAPQRPDRSGTPLSEGRSRGTPRFHRATKPKRPPLSLSVLRPLLGGGSKGSLRGLGDPPSRATFPASLRYPLVPPDNRILSNPLTGVNYFLPPPRFFFPVPTRANSGWFRSPGGGRSPPRGHSS